MKQWLYDGWFRFKAWALFNYWRYLTSEDANELRKFYYLKRWEERAMNRYVEDISSRKYTETEHGVRYIGTIDPEKMMNVNLEKKDE